MDSHKDKPTHRLYLALLFAVVVVLMVGSLLWLSRPAEPGRESLPDFTVYPAGPERKAAFFSYLSPLLTAQNKKLLEQRAELEDIAAKLKAGKKLRRSHKRLLTELASRYHIQLSEGMPGSEEVAVLLRRVDMIPRSLALVQAALESAWGTSRFARSANNLFGEWCYTPGCGLVPRNRKMGMRHEVRSFANVSEAVESYYLNINTHSKYLTLRTIRWNRRQANLPITGTALADGLLFYSERREAYVEEIKHMIRINRSYFSHPQLVSRQ